MQTSKHLLLALLLALLPQSQGQTYSSCDPTKKTCPPNPGMKTGTWSANLASSKGLPAGVSQMKSQGTINYASSGAEFVVEKPKDSPTIITDSYFFFGYAEARMKASAGVGIVSSFVLESDDLDEVDWEFMGIEPNQVQSNYYGKGPDGTSVRGARHPVSTVQTEFHTYAVNWTTTALTFFIDGAPVRTVKAADAKDKYPQTPMRLKIGIWCTGTPDRQPGDIAWGGGLTDFTKGPFKMLVESVKILNYSPASQYRYKDNSGSWQSIEVIGGKTGDDKPDAPSSSSGVPGSTSSSASRSSTSVTVPSESPTPISNGTGTTSSTASSSSTVKTTESATKPTASTGSVGSLVIPSFSAVCLVFIPFVL